MRRRALVALAALLLSAAVPLAAQDPPDRAPRIGLGVVLNPAVLLAFDDDDFISLPGLNNFIVPVRVTERLTFEPEFGLMRWSSSTSGSGFSSEGSVTSVRLGVGVLRSFGRRGGVAPYAGLRGGILRFASKTHNVYSGGTSDYEEKRQDWYASVVVGGQYYFTSHVSLGAEAQATRTSLGQEEINPPPGPPPEYSSSVISTSGLIMLRLYF